VQSHNSWLLAKQGLFALPKATVLPILAYLVLAAVICINLIGRPCSIHFCLWLRLTAGASGYLPQSRLESRRFFSRVQNRQSTVPRRPIWRIFKQTSQIAVHLYQRFTTFPLQHKVRQVKYFQVMVTENVSATSTQIGLKPVGFPL
jgi:hypothetical protein